MVVMTDEGYEYLLGIRNHLIQGAIQNHGCIIALTKEANDN